MSKFRISKQDVIEAIRTEPLLAPGSWMTTWDKDNDSTGDWSSLEGTTTSSAPNPSVECRVCAVGAVIRRIIDTDTPLSKGRFFINENLNFSYNVTSLGLVPKEELFQRGAALAKHKPWNALSIVFETLAQTHGLKAPNRGANRARYREALQNVRTDLVEFVEKHMPEDLVFNSKCMPVKPGIKAVEESE